MRRSPAVAAAVVLALLLAGCTTTVAGTGRPGAAAAPSASGSGSPTGGSASSSPTDGATGTGDALRIWDDVSSAVVDLPAVTVSGTFAGAGFGADPDDPNGPTGAPTIQASYGTADGEPLAEVTVTTTDAGAFEVRATGGTAWARGSAALWQAYGYTPEEAAAAGDKWAVLTDDDSGIDVFASLAGFLQICGPDDSDDDLTATQGSDGRYTLASELADGSLVVTTSPRRIVSSAYSGDDLTFSYPESAPAVEAPAAADVVTVPDF